MNETRAEQIYQQYINLINKNIVKSSYIYIISIRFLFQFNFNEKKYILDWLKNVT